jgi:sugar phosphate isomerase/epimerase
MQLGFVSAIFFDLSLDDVFAFAADEGFGCVELMCWPPGAADRRYAGVTHVDVTQLNEDRIGHVRELARKHGVAISGLGYYPNPLHGDAAHRKFVIDHLKRVISAAPLLDVRLVNTFIGRDPVKPVEHHWPLFQEVWSDIVNHAEMENVRVAIENCPMLFSLDEWPGGANLAVSPAIWRTMFEEIPSQHLGLNFDPSHLIWQHIDYVRSIREFGSRIYHVHAKDERIDRDSLYEHGILGLGWHTAKLPGLGDVNWGRLVSALTDTGYHGAFCIEVEDRAFEESLNARKRALRQSKRYLEQFIS